MVRRICKDPIFLSRKSVDATINDMDIARDLKDTLEDQKEGCVGMAANMIGVNKKIIVFEVCGNIVTMFNPEIVSKSSPTEMTEGCLCFSGVKTVKRYLKIKVKYLDDNFKPQENEYIGFTAEIIQHEIDHLNGILV